VIMVGDTSFATNKYITVADNRRLSENLLRHLAGL